MYRSGRGQKSSTKITVHVAQGDRFATGQTYYIHAAARTVNQLKTGIINAMVLRTTDSKTVLRL